MSMKQVQKLLEKLEDALQDVEIDLDSAVEECDDYEFQLSETTEALELMEVELRLLCKLIYDSKTAMPLDGHFMDINPYVSPDDPFKGEYGMDERKKNTSLTAKNRMCNILSLMN